MSGTLTFLCITTYFKGNDFFRACKEAEVTVLLLTSRKLENKPWASEAIDEFFYIEGQGHQDYNPDDLIKGVAYVFRSRRIDRVVALDDYDVEKAAVVREAFRIPGMGRTTAGYFRDKLAMRMKAAESGIRVPGFSSLFNDEQIEEFIKKYPGPWMIKPRREASATGITKSHTREELWDTINSLGDMRHEYLVEQFKAGDVYHVDSLTLRSKVIFSWSSIYLAPPFDVAHGGGIFRSATVPFGTPEQHALETLSVDVLNAFGLRHSASHTEVIRSADDGHYYFLETSCRVGGAHLADMIEASSGVNLWKEWAKIEIAEALGQPYQLPRVRKEYAGIIISLSRHQWPDMSPFDDPEVVWALEEEYHVGCIVQSPRRERVIELLDKYAEIVQRDYHASAPPSKSPTN